MSTVRRSSAFRDKFRCTAPQLNANGSFSYCLRTNTPVSTHSYYRCVSDGLPPAALRNRDHHDHQCERMHRCGERAYTMAMTQR